MNVFNGVGRLTRDPDIRRNGESVTAKFTVAINRKFKDASGNYGADFPSCIAFGKTAEFIEKYFHKGMAIGFTGRVQTGSYTNKDGQKVYTTDIVAEEIEFVESKNASAGNNAPQTQAAPPSQMPPRAPSQPQGAPQQPQPQYYQGYQNYAPQQAQGAPQQYPPQYQQGYQQAPQQQQDFMQIPPGAGDELPFT